MVQWDQVRQIIESISEGMMMCDHNGRIILANGRLSQMLEIDIHEDMHTDEFISQLHRRADCSNIISIINEFREGKTILNVDNHTRFTYTSKTEVTQYYDLYLRIITRIQNGDNGYLFVFRDRTEEEKVDELKNEFVSLVSHELRTPLSSILGFVEILLHREIAPDKQKKYLETVFKEATRLSNLIHEFLDLQRIEAGKQLYQFSPVSLNTLIQELADRYNSSFTHQIHIQWIDDPSHFTVSGDYDRLIQAFDNLLSNAVKYSPGKERIDLSMRHEGYMIHVDIKDYGLGIPEFSRNKLFEKFYRVDNSDRRKVGGTGLGLAIAKEIIEAHQGEISYESILGDGSTFTVTLNRLANGSDHQ